MRTTIVLLFMGLQVAACGEEPAPTAIAALRFDGVYRCRSAEERDDPVWLFLRLYADRLVVVRDTLLLFNDEEVEGYDLLEGDSRLQQALPADGDSDTVALRLKKPVPKPVERER